MYPNRSPSRYTWNSPAPSRGERYRLNDFRWEGFWVTEEEFERACRGAVTDFSIARAWQGEW